MKEFKKYKRKNIAEMRPYVEGEDMSGISISTTDEVNGSPKDGDMIARNPNDHSDQWLVGKEYFEDNFEQIYDYDHIARLRSELFCLKVRTGQI